MTHRRRLPFALALALACWIGEGAPGEGTPPPNRANLRKLRVRGNTFETDRAVDAALSWLATHQDPDGSWDCDGFMKHDPLADLCEGPGKMWYDVGVTGLALLAFLGAGYTNAEGPYSTNVAGGIAFLRGAQDKEGCLGKRRSQHFIYMHAIGTMALAEAYWLTKREDLRDPLIAAVRFVEGWRNPGRVWRYSPSAADNDTSVTAWCMSALQLAALAGIQVDGKASECTLLWIDEMTHPEKGEVGYIKRDGGSARPEGLQDAFPSEMTQSMTAAALFTRITLGEDPAKGALTPKQTKAILSRPPRWTPPGAIDMYYWYWGSLAMREVGGASWKKWESAFRKAVLENQHTKGAKAGSWDPVDPWALDGGRIYSTALITLSLEAYYRYDGVFQKKK